MNISDFLGFKKDPSEKDDKLGIALTIFNNAFNDFEDALIKDIQDKFVNPMKDLWCSGEAVEFFNNVFEPEIKNLNANALNMFTCLYNTVNDVRTRWYLTTNIKNYKKHRMSVRQKKIDVSNIKEISSGGAIGIAKEEALEKADLLRTSTKIKCSAALEKIKTAGYNCGLLGGGQQGSLDTVVKSYETKLNETLDNLFQKVKKLMENVADKYAQTASSVSSSISGITMGAVAGAVNVVKNAANVAQNVANSVSPVNDSVGVSGPTVNEAVGGGIGSLSEAIKSGDVDKIKEYLNNSR